MLTYHSTYYVVQYTWQNSKNTYDTTLGPLTGTVDDFRTAHLEEIAPSKKLASGSLITKRRWRRHTLVHCGMRHFVLLLSAILASLQVTKAWVSTKPCVFASSTTRIPLLPPTLRPQQRHRRTTSASLIALRVFSADDYDTTPSVGDLETEELSDEELAATMGEWDDRMYVTRHSLVPLPSLLPAAACHLTKNVAPYLFLYSARYNTVHLTGRVGNDPEPRYFDDGKVVVNLSLATRRKYHSLDRSVQKIEWGEEETDWYGLEIWVNTNMIYTICWSPSAMGLAMFSHSSFFNSEPRVKQPNL